MKPRFTKTNSLLPVLIQDAQTMEVLMLGYMNKAAYAKTKQTGRVTFFSRSKNRLWTKGEASGHELRVVSIHTDCDSDAILIKTKPAGPTCHTGTRSCFDTDWNQNFLFQLERIIDERWKSNDSESYVYRLRHKGVARAAQKVIEEAGEAALAAVAGSRSQLTEESADLVFHIFGMLKHRDIPLRAVAKELEKRHRPQRGVRRRTR